MNNSHKKGTRFSTVFSKPFITRLRSKGNVRNISLDKQSIFRLSFRPLLTLPGLHSYLLREGPVQGILTLGPSSFHACSYWLSTCFLWVGCFFCLFVCFGRTVRLVGILVPWPGIEPRPTAVRALNPNHWTAREFPWFCLHTLPFHLLETFNLNNHSFF